MSFFLTSTVSMLVVLRRHGSMVHEFGRFFAVAKLCGVRVEVFSIGFGKRLFGFRRGDTDYTGSACFPLGGYVFENVGGISRRRLRPGDPAEFNAHPRWQRILIGLAGPVSNFLLATAAHDQLPRGCTTRWKPFRSQAANIDFVSDHTAAATAGLKAGDVITRFG